MAKKYYWLKLKDDFFSQKEIKKLRKIAGGDTYTIIYLKMLLIAIKQENKLYFEGVEETFAEELALELDEDTENTKVVLAFLERQGLIQLVSEDEFLLTRCKDMIGSETDSAERVRRSREIKALQCNTNVTGVSQDCNTEIEIEKEIEYQLIVDMYNDTCVSFPKVTKLSENRKKAIKARANTGYTIDDFKILFNMAEQSNFLKGKNSRNWSATFDWLIQDANMAKVLDGNYKDRISENQNGKNNDTLLNMIERGDFNE